MIAKRAIGLERRPGKGSNLACALLEGATLVSWRIECTYEKKQ